jgi:hypothetical protein
VIMMTSSHPAKRENTGAKNFIGNYCLLGATA